VRDRGRVLQYAAIVFGVTLAFHNGDHFRRGTDTVTDEVAIAGTVVGIVSIVAIVLALMRHPLAPRVATIVGSAVMIGIVGAHLLPHWSAFSDSFPDAHHSVLSWAAVLSELVGGAVFAAAGLYALRRREPVVSAPSSAAGSR
jgi:hypothetical protein